MSKILIVKSLKKMASMSVTEKIENAHIVFIKREQGFELYKNRNGSNTKKIYSFDEFNKFKSSKNYFCEEI
ncbi:hypothetical protein N5T63_09305 [Aliarcobacter cryaerophilus]|uniref:hypothetical protein n=1 Tax=Aliarcobacter cryaerophilus TaxID=28198 RepID=UPI0021B52CCB|nr:hypothetical protein [Aliarcobacter cryaerophilus]MCT7489093.1 hypothetical protein [Aliarcobacter cryaerophilus]